MIRILIAGINILDIAAGYIVGDYKAVQDNCKAFFRVRYIRIAGEIVIEISAADHIIALLVFRFQIGEEHLHLGIALGGVGSVCGSVKVDQYQLFSVLDRYTGNAVAAVQIQNLLKISRDRQAPAQGGTDIGAA